jgi:tetratricopeptide (TPR) repeat protein
MGRGQIDDAATQFRKYRRLAERMIATDSDNPKWQLEGVYSASNLGIVELQQARYADAAQTFRASVGATDRLVASELANLEYRKLQMEALAYYAQALDGAGQLDLAIQQRERQLALLAPYLAIERPNAALEEKAMIANRQLAHYRFRRGDTTLALGHAAAAIGLGQRLTELEPSNAEWTSQTASAMLDQAQIMLRSGKLGEARVTAGRGCALANGLVARDPTVVTWRDASLNCLRLRAELATISGPKDEAVALANRVLEQVRSINGPADRFALPQAQKLVGDVLWLSGNRSGATNAWKAGLAAWPKGIAETPVQMAARGEMLRGVGRRVEGNQIASRLVAMGYRQSITNRARV